MAETMTYDPGTDTVTTENSLTPDEQDSLEVGEALQEQQEGLLAGKYKNAEELEKAYGELERKLGEQGNKDSETVDETEIQESDKVSEEEKETSEDSAATTLLESASKEYYDNDNSLSQETIDKFAEMSSTELVNAYLQSIKGKDTQQQTQAVPELTERDVNVVKNAAGGEKEYGKIVQWARENYEQGDIDSFNNLVATGNVGAIKLAVAGLKAQYQDANGYEGKMYSGKPPATSKDVYRSQQEVIAAMEDPRYDRDPAYRQEVIEKLDRSDNVQF